MALATALAWAAVSDWPPSTETPPLADAIPEATTLLIVRPEGHVLAGLHSDLVQSFCTRSFFFFGFEAVVTSALSSLRVG